MDTGEAIHSQSFVDIRYGQGAGTAFRLGEDFAALRILGRAGAGREICVCC